MEPRFRRALVVDDDGDVAAITARALVLLNLAAEAEVAGSAETAWERLSAESPDLVIADLRLPEMDGLELLDKIRAVLPRVKCILMTGDDSFETQRMARRKGLEQVVAKPFTVDRLADAVRALSTSSAAPGNGAGRPRESGHQSTPQIRNT